MSFSNTLVQILNELQQYKNNDKLITKYVEQRLSQSLNQYYKDLNSSLNFLNSPNRDFKKLAKKLNKDEGDYLL